MKIAVVGNCQHAPLAQCLQVLLPAAKIKMIALNQRGATDPAWDSSFADSEIIVTQLSPESPSLAERYPNKQILTYPRLAFAGYFPDFTMVYANGRPIGSPIGNFHSSIAAWAFANGLTASSACQLFREDVYRFLGYLDSWTKAEGALLREGQLSGFPLNDLLAKWTRRHPFMHAATHPKLFVMADIARQIADRLDPGSPPCRQRTSCRIAYFMPPCGLSILRSHCTMASVAATRSSCRSTLPLGARASKLLTSTSTSGARTRSIGSTRPRAFPRRPGETNHSNPLSRWSMAPARFRSGEIRTRDREELTRLI